MLENQTILVTGVTGQVAFPVAAELAKRNRVLALGRYGRDGDRERVAAVGAEPVVGDLAAGQFANIPDGLDYVLHFAVAKSGEDDFNGDLAMNAEGVGLLMQHCRNAKAFLHCSTTGVYRAKEEGRIDEASPLADHHRHMLSTYSICKIAAEAVVRTSARQLDLPTTIARLAVPYGSAGGWPWFHLMMMKAGVPIPVHPSGTNYFPLLHEEDYVSHIEGLLGLASVPATIVNWAGSEDTSVEEWCRYLGELTGLEPKFEASETALEPLLLDTSQLKAKVGPSKVHWKDGIRALVEARNPELLKG
jgi:nucleoside-diphosphate-sugar epimerase